jgi:hypothetical protein
VEEHNPCKYVYIGTPDQGKGGWLSVSQTVGSQSQNWLTKNTDQTWILYPLAKQGFQSRQIGKSFKLSAEAAATKQIPDPFNFL